MSYVLEASCIQEPHKVDEGGHSISVECAKGAVQQSRAGFGVMQLGLMAPAQQKTPAAPIIVQIQAQ